jgi:hypothetical protein
LYIKQDQFSDRVNALKAKGQRQKDKEQRGVFEKNEAIKKDEREGRTMEQTNLKQVMLKKLPSEWINDGSFSLAVKAYKTPISIAIGVPIIIILSYKIYGKFIKS